MNEDLDNLKSDIAETLATVSKYLPGLLSPAPGAALLLYVVQPRPHSELADIMFPATPPELHLIMSGGLRAEEIRGIYSVDEPEAALALAQRLMAEVQGAGK